MKQAILSAMTSFGRSVRFRLHICKSYTILVYSVLGSHTSKRPGKIDSQFLVGLSLDSRRTFFGKDIRT